MKKVLAFFGAFNPPTNAHINLAEFAMKATERDEVIFVPSKGRYIADEQKKDYAFADAVRLEMLNDVKIDRPWMTVCDYDITSENQPRTYETLCILREDGIEPSLLIGSDVLFKMEKEWLNVDKIAAEFGIVCLTRGDTEEDAKTDAFLSPLLPHITFVEAPEEYEWISSTGVRKDLKKALSVWNGICSAVPPEVAALLLKDFFYVIPGGSNEI